MIPDQISVVLIRSKGSFNIGATCRAMQNMGLDRLILVNPQTEIDVHAREGAASAQAILARRIVYQDMKEFFANEGEGLRIAFTRRDGHKRGLFDFGSFCQDHLSPKLKNEYSSTPIYLMFGSEEDGLNNEEIELANYCVMLPTFGPQGSLNLSQAVLLALFTLQSELAKQGLTQPQESSRPIDRSPVEFPKPLIDEFLTTLGFNLVQFKRKNAADVLNNLILRSVPSPDDSRILSSVLYQTIRKLKDRFEPIGHVESVFKTKFGTPRQPLLAEGAKATIKLNPKLQPELSLQGLEGFSHIWLIFQFHENSNKIFRPKIHPPRLEGRTIGTFATRTPHRPNPIGLSLVKLDKIENGVLHISGVDLIDGTPILDIKPYLKYVESQPTATEGWVENHQQTPFPVEFVEDFDQKVMALEPSWSSKEVSHFRDFVTEVLEKDPRPLAYKGETLEGTQREHAVYLDDWNLFFEYKNDLIQVTGIEKT